MCLASRASMHQCNCKHFANYLTSCAKDESYLVKPSQNLAESLLFSPNPNWTEEVFGVLPGRLRSVLFGVLPGLGLWSALCLHFFFFFLLLPYQWFLGPPLVRLRETGPGAHCHSGGISPCCWVRKRAARTSLQEVRCWASWRDQVRLQLPHVFGKSNRGEPLSFRHLPSATRTGTHLKLPVLPFELSLLRGSDWFCFLCQMVLPKEIHVLKV